MAFEDLQTEITGLFDTMTDRPEDIHELAALIREKLNELKATGMPLPDDLVALEAQLEAIENAPDAPDPETVRPSPEAEEQHDPLLESPGPPPE
jgi:hypothetical protein